ncbi:4-alpha-glucanotransferase [Tsuneonella dongtanensis]|uniref:4-alpha-glucanotransferase n=2 Tax=Tsuneonella dongtanensis TaxID=692370 RepID=A0A1B2AFT9_9SPHN|nr:4-alpha-glucanotransferase [Tsuneonella dongtanensis]
MLVADIGESLALPFLPEGVAATAEDGRIVELRTEGASLVAPGEPGYYDLDFGSERCRLAVAPHRAPGFRSRGMWGAAVQIPALRTPADGPFGDFADLAAAVPHFSAQGAAALAINPVHALFPGEGRNFSPYSPSSRLFLNGAMANPSLAGLPPFPQARGEQLIDWQAALPQRLRHLRDVFDTLEPEAVTRVLSDPGSQDATLRRHALFDALYCHFDSDGTGGFHDWPVAYRDPGSPQVAAFAAAHARELDFHLFVQWLARAGLAACQAATVENGMAVGLIADLAVGVHPGGSDCWSLGPAMLAGLSVGAPPDPLGPQGQNWHLSQFSPQGLKRTGYAPFISMLRAGFAAGGGLRVDHAFGLERLWVIPSGGGATDGAYLSYPRHDLVRLLTLEAYRAQSVVIAENLGTAPFGFAEYIADRGLMGMDVLWFQRAADHGFIGAHDYSPDSVAMSGTHDTPTVAGWWSGRDLDWAERCGRLPPGIDNDQANAIRDWDRGLLWSTVGRTGARPAPEQPSDAVDAVIAHIASSPSPLAIVPLEDLIGDEEQPNLPGTVTEHPNWRRRLHEPIGAVLQEPTVAARAATLSARSPAPET